MKRQQKSSKILKNFKIYLSSNKCIKKNKEMMKTFLDFYARFDGRIAFCFILVIGAIVIRYVYTQKISNKKKVALNSSETENQDF